MPTLATFLLLSFPLLAQTGGKPAEGQSAEKIAAAVRRLGSDDFATRQQATDELWRAGPAAKSALEAAAKSDDLEVALRAKSLLEKFRFGIFPDTPPETLALIEAYRSGDHNQKSESLRQLQKMKQWGTLVALVRAESSPELRRSFIRSFQDGLRQSARDELSQGEIDRAEELLSWLAEFDEYGASHRDYAALLLYRGKLAGAIDTLQEAGTYRSERSAARLLARLLQVQGELQQARSIAELTADKDLKADLYHRLEDWPALTALIPGDRGVENLGFAAAFHRLAGNQAAADKAVADLRALAVQEPNDAWLCAEALMINERWQDAIEVVPPAYSNYAFECLCGQMRFAEAFRLAGIEQPRAASAEWFARRAAGLDPASNEAAQHIELGLAVARALTALGEREESLRLLAELARLPDDKYGGRSASLLKVEEEMGLQGQAKNRALEKLGDERGALHVMFRWYGEEGAYVACWWWKFLCRIAPDEDRALTLARLQNLMRPGEGAALSGESLAELAGRAERASEELKLEERVAALGYIGQVCAFQGDLKRARAYLEKQAELAREIPVSEFQGYEPPRTVSPLLRIGDLYAQEKSWPEAAEAYGRAWQLQKERTGSLYLQGYALERAGKLDEGRRLMELAELLPLADTERREQLASVMEKLGQRESAHKQWEIILRLGAFEGWEGAEDWAVQRACRALAVQLADQDKLRAAGLWQHYLHYLLKTNSGFTEASGYPEIVHQFHALRTQGLLEAGRVAEALPELALAQAAMPGDVELVERAMPLLARGGRVAEAEKLFQEAYEAFDKVCRDFPRSGSHHNQAAWLAARCGQRLDDALAHAEQAVALNGEKMSYVDTLAEVHFRRGDVQRAIELEKQALKREPNNQHFQEQLRRFEKRE
jgi:hypothetical protein